MPSALLRETTTTPPGPVGDSLHEARTDPMGLFLRGAFRYGGIVRYRFGEREAYMISDPEMIQQMLVGHRAKYIKSSRYDVLLPILGRGLLLSEGEEWRSQNSKARPAFRPELILRHWDRMTDAVAGRLEQWSTWAASGEVVDIEAEMTRITQAVVGPWTMGPVYWKYAEELAELLFVGKDGYLASRREQSGQAPADPQEGYKRVVAGLDRIFYEVAAHVRQHPGDDFLSLYLNAAEEAGETVDDQELRDQAATIFIPGHESSSSTLAWLWYVLCTVPGVRDRLCAEIDAVLGPRTPSVDDVSKLDFATRTVKEVLRLYPPACSFSRTATEDDEIGGYHIPSGSQVIVCAYATHRLPKYWRDPEMFDPQRFVPEEVEQRPRWSYYPFGLGQRACIGGNLGLQQVVLILAMTLQRYRLDVMPGHPIENEYQVVLRPKGGMPMTVQPRPAL